MCKEDCSCEVECKNCKCEESQESQEAQEAQESAEVTKKKRGRKPSALDSTATHMICNVCKVDKPMNEFNLDRSKRCGHQYTCRECSNAIVTKHTAENYEAYVAREKSWYESKGKNYYKKYYQKNKKALLYNQKKFTTIKKLKKLIEAGEYVKPCSCCKCFDSSKKLYAIFDSFEDIKNVRWLCYKCKKSEK
jgi:hypothetical protein